MTTTTNIDLDAIRHRYDDFIDAVTDLEATTTHERLYYARASARDVMPLLGEVRRLHRAIYNLAHSTDGDSLADHEELPVGEILRILLDDGRVDLLVDGAA